MRRIRVTGRSFSLSRHSSVRWHTAVLAFLVGLIAFSADDALGQRESYEEAGGTFGDGTRYLMRIPSNWNRTLIRDLDYATNPNNDRYLFLLAQGYAVSGTARHERRETGGYDPIREIERLAKVQEVFESRFGSADRVIQFGCSGGGRVGTLISEYYPEQVDGVVSAANGSILWTRNSHFDTWFVLQTLLDVDLPIVNLPPPESSRASDNRGDLYPSLVFAWRDVINEAQRTPEGRARIALAFAIGQLPHWVNPHNPKPDPNDTAELQRAMYLSMLEFEVNRPARYMIESAPGFGTRTYQASWNDDVDYREFFSNANQYHARAARALYNEASMDLEADLDALDRSATVSADPEAIEYWSAPGRLGVGLPQVPVLRVQDIGDASIPPSVVQGYADLVRANGKEDLFRVIYTEAPTHCTFTTSEVAAMIETLMHRLDTGAWGSTEPEDLNELARSLHGTRARFIPLEDWYKVDKYNRTWVPN